MNRTAIKMLAASAACFSFHATAATTVGAGGSADVAASGSTSLPTLPKGEEAQRLVNLYSGFSGSTDNAVNLVSGLRNGNPITLSASGSSTATDSVTFTPPTKAMGWGEVQRTLFMARQTLAAQGISDPTPAQIQTALSGGTLTSASAATSSAAGATTTVLPGILTLRSQGMGWGQIAHALEISPANSMAGVTNSRGTLAADGAGGIRTAASQSVAVTGSARGEAKESGSGRRHVTLGSGENAAVTANAGRAAAGLDASTHGRFSVIGGGAGGGAGGHGGGGLGLGVGLRR